VLGVWLDRDSIRLICRRAGLSRFLQVRLHLWLKTLEGLT